MAVADELLGYLGTAYLCSLVANMVAQVFAVGFALACAIAVCRPFPYCLVGSHLARWSLYSALTALAIPVSVGVLMLGVRLTHPSEGIAETMAAASFFVYHPACFTSPALGVAILASLISRVSLRRLSPIAVPVRWYNASGDLVVLAIAGIPLASLAVFWFLSL
jgi:hypothetical protein